MIEMINKDDIDKMKNEKDVDKLIYAIRLNDVDIKIQAIKALGEIDNKRALDALIYYLRDPIPDIRINAAEALGNIENPSSINPLIDLINDNNIDVRNHVTLALIKFGEIAINQLYYAFDVCYGERLWFIARTLSNMGEEGLRALVFALLNKNEEVKYIVTETICNLEEEKKKLILEIVRKNPTNEWRFINILGLMGNKKAVSYLNQTILDNDPQIRLQSIKALEKIGDPRSVDALEAVSNDRAIVDGSNIGSYAREVSGKIRSTIDYKVFYSRHLEEFRFKEKQRDLDKARELEEKTEFFRAKKIYQKYNLKDEIKRLEYLIEQLLIENEKNNELKKAEELEKNMKFRQAVEIYKKYELTDEINRLDSLFSSHHSQALKFVQEYKFDEAIELLKNIGFTREAIRIEKEKKEFEKYLHDAEELLKTKTKENLENAIKIFKDLKFHEKVNEIENLIDELSNAESILNIEFQEENVRPNRWEKVNLIVENTGGLVIKDIDLSMTGKIDVYGINKNDIEIESLEPDELRKIPIRIKTMDEGLIPIEVHTVFRRVFDNKSVSETLMPELNVEETPITKKSDNTAFTRKDTHLEESDQGVIIKRGYSLTGDMFKFGVKIENNLSYKIYDVDVKLRAPEAFTLVNPKSNVYRIRNIDSNTSETAIFLMRPIRCISGYIKGTVEYEDPSSNDIISLQIKPKKIESICPFIQPDSILETEYIRMVNNYAISDDFVQTGYSFNGTTIDSISNILIEKCSNMSLIGEHNFNNEKLLYFSGKSTIDKIQYLLTVALKEESECINIAFKGYSTKKEGLVGFLSEITDCIRYSIAALESTKEVTKIEMHNVQKIIDSVLVRSKIKIG